MKLNFRALSLGAVVLLSPGFVKAESQTYHCVFGPAARKNLQNNEFLLEIASKSQSARVFNREVGYASAAPMAAKLTVLNDGKLGLRWTVKGLPGALTRTSDGDPVSRTEVKVRVSFKVEFDTNTLQFSYRQRTHGGGNWWSPEEGECRTLGKGIESYIRQNPKS